MLPQLYWTTWSASSVQKEQPGLSRKAGEDSGSWVKQKGRSPRRNSAPCEAMA